MCLTNIVIHDDKNTHIQLTVNFLTEENGDAVRFKGLFVECENVLSFNNFLHIIATGICVRGLCIEIRREIFVVLSLSTTHGIIFVNGVTSKHMRLCYAQCM